ncbi:MAG: glycoside hydrolase family 44 protein [Bryobacteraceae bacterium]
MSFSIAAVLSQAGGGAAGAGSDAKHSAISGGPYAPVVSAPSPAGESASLAQAAAAAVAPPTQVSVTVDTLTDRHAISPYVYGGAYPNTSAQIADSGTTVVRWGGNATTNYNWQTQTSNSANDYWFSDYTYRIYNGTGTPDSTAFITQTIAAGANPLMTMPMVAWVSKGSSANGTDNGQLYSFAVSKYGAQCTTRPDNGNAGNGVKPDCQTDITGNDPHDAYVPLLDTATTPCPATASPCTGFVNRQDWTAALSAAFGSAQHFYDMDNEVDIWGGTHRDMHPNPTGYEEWRDTYLTEARNLKTWDPAAVRLGPVSCCWWYYWNGANANDKPAHGNIDLLPWWLNEVYWHDQLDGTRSVDLFDIHAYPDGPDTSNYTQAQDQALSLSIYRDYWDPTYVSPTGSDINQIWVTSIQPNRIVPFRIPRMRAMVNMIYPGTPLAITEWSAAFAGEGDFSTALADADGYGILGREEVQLASRWEAPVPTNPNYQALKLYRNYDGNHSTFGTTSVSATHNADPDLFSVYASLAPAGSALKMVVINKDPANAAQVTFALNHFSPGTFTSYTLSQASPSAIVASSSQTWNATQTFQPYTATLLVINGTLPSTPAAEWGLNPDAIQVPANGSVALAPQIVSGSGSVTLTAAQFDSSSACATSGGSMSITAAQLPGAIAVSPGSGLAAGFCHFTVTGQDSAGVTQTQGGWIVVGYTAATLANTTSSASGAPGTQVTLSVTLTPGAAISSPVCTSVASCGPSYAAGASVLFSVDAGSLAGGVYPAAPGLRQIAKAGATGVASVQLTLPASAGTVHVTAEGPYGLGHPVIQFAETVQGSGTAPQAPVLTSPANGATDLTIPLTLSWQAASGAASYNVYFGTTSPPPLLGQTTLTAFNPGALTLGATYYWSVAAVNSGGSTSSAIWSFQTTSSSTGVTGLEFVPVTPCRIADTRNAAGPFGGPTPTGGSTRSFAIPQSTCNIPATAQAYSLNVTVVPQSTLGYLTLWPTGQTQPFVSTLNSLQGAVVANAAIVPAGTGGAVSVYVTDTTDVILDINGYFATPGASSYAFYPATPCRVADTRNATGPFGGPSMAGAASRAFAVPSAGCNIPATAQAYALNVTVVPEGVLYYLTLWPTGESQPLVSTLNSFAGAILANAAIVPAGTNESVSVYVTNPTNVILDINGYFGAPGGTGALSFYPVTPCRIADTRNANGPFGGPIVASGTTRSFTIPASGCSVPGTAAAYSLNVTVVPDGPLAYLTTWPAGSPQPVVSTLNSSAGTVAANAAIVPAGAGGAISVYADGQTQVILDINGYFAP